MPPEVEAAINRKEEQKQLNLEYDYRLLREAKETERKRIEASGIREFQDIVSSGITDSYLRWKGIEATLELARSNNAKVVIVGGGKDGLPIILGNMDDGAGKMSVRPVGDSTTGSQSEAAPPGLPSASDGGNAPPLPSAVKNASGNAAEGGKPALATPSNSPAMSGSPPGATAPAGQPSPSKEPAQNK